MWTSQISLFLRTSSTSPPRRRALAFAGGVGQIAERNFTCRPGTRAISLPLSDLILFTLRGGSSNGSTISAACVPFGTSTSSMASGWLTVSALSASSVAADIGGRLRERDRPQPWLPGDFQLQLERLRWPVAVRFRWA